MRILNTPAFTIQNNKHNPIVSATIIKQKHVNIRIPPHNNDVGYKDNILF